MIVCRLSQSSTTLIHGPRRISLPSNHPLSSFAIKTTGKVKAAVVSREDDLLSYTNGNAPLSNGSLVDDRIEEPEQADSGSLGTLAADSGPAPANGFVSEDDDYELDLPTPGFSSIPEAIEDIRQGKVRLYHSLCLNESKFLHLPIVLVCISSVDFGG